MTAEVVTIHGDERRAKCTKCGGTFFEIITTLDGEAIRAVCRCGNEIPFDDVGEDDG